MARSKKVVRSKKASCLLSLRRKIKVNMKEYKSGRWVSPKQALAVSYSQVKKRRPECKRYFKRSRND